MISLAGGCVLHVVWIYTVFAAHTDLGILYLSYPVTWAATSLALYIAFRICLKKEERKATVQSL